VIVHAEYRQKNGDDPTLSWLSARLGKVTASEIENLITNKGEVKKGEGPKTFLAEKLAESWQGAPLDSFQSFAMGQGVVLEEKAIPYASLMYDLEIAQVGFIETNDGRAGCSPDGIMFKDEGITLNKEVPTVLISQAGWSGLEIKCPELKTHVKYLLSGELPAQYMPQVQFSMWVTGCETWHFMSYNRTLPAFHVIVERDEEFQDAISEALALFYPQFDKGMKRLEEINGGPNKNRVNLVPKREPKPESQSDDLIP
jgi:YqaJ-like viral recombinase domain